MTYIIFFIYLIFCAFVSVKTKSDHFFLFTIMALLLVIIGFRDTSVGADTLGYTQNFYEYSQLQFAQMWRTAIASKEPLYVVISWLASLLSYNYTAYLLVWAIFPVLSLYKTFRMELSGGVDYMIAILVFFMLGLFAFFVAGIRQTAAMSLTLASARYLMRINNQNFKTFIKDRNLYIFLLYVGIACLIHNSALVFLLVIPCLFIKVRWWYLFLSIGLFFLGKFVQIDLIVELSGLLFEDRFAAYGATATETLSISGFIMQFLLFFICFIVKDKLSLYSRNNDFLLMLLFVGLLFQSLSIIQAEMARVSYYFSMFAMILVPRSIKMYGYPWRGVLYWGFVIVSLFYLFFLSSSNLPAYRFV